MTTSIQRAPKPRSAQLWDRACAVMPGGVSSPVRAFKAVGGTPVFLERAAGAHVFDADGNRYIDLVGAWGPAIAGHAHPAVVEAVQRAAADGLGFGACHHLEAALAERIIAAFPPGHVEMLRFVTSGTEACMSAARLARGATRRERLLKFQGHYHGHADSFLVSAGSGAAALGTPGSPGVPEAVARQTLLAPFNDLEAVSGLMDRHGHEVAAVFVEPVAGNMGFVPPAPGFLEGLRQLCDRHGALLVFDEVMTGFRVVLGGYQNLCGVRPDLTCLGKVIGGGMPVAAYGGSRRLMEQMSPSGSVYQAGTLSGNPVALAAGLATLRLCEEPGFYERLGRSSARLADGLRQAAAEAGIPLSTGSLGGMLGAAFTAAPPADFADMQAGDHQRFARVFQAMLDRGVWLPPSQYEAMFVSAAHTEADIGQVLAAARGALGEVA